MTAVVNGKGKTEVSTNSHEMHELSHSEHTVGRGEQLVRIALVGFIVVGCLLKLPYSHSLAVVGSLAGGWPIFEEAISNLREKRMTMELSMSIALFAALAISESFTALVITFSF